jgi:KEOPS complex subunit Cgi121
MEGLLFAAGTRQCSTAASFGLHEGGNNLWVCCHPPAAGIWDRLRELLHYPEHVTWDTFDEEKTGLLMQLFAITPGELAAAGGPARISDLVLERVALLQVVR